MQGPLVNFSFYRFLRLEGLPALRESLRALGAELGLRGTILLAPEGVNAMISGEEPSVIRFAAAARALFGDFQAKQVRVAEHSFHRFLVKLKKEIISVGDPTLDPAQRTGKRLSPAELKAWLDEGRPCVLLDTRNAYEIEVGTFRGARHLWLDASGEFAEKARAALPSWRGLPVVTFCTGGIRCEKASAYLAQCGVEEVHQLDGGILRYLEENGTAHFDGACFVYDWRLAVNGKLEPVPRSADPSRSFGRHKRPPRRAGSPTG